ncbi:hypothetical protein N9384_00280 [bacterium]|nr:hypothetical protein [bacterium]
MSWFSGFSSGFKKYTSHYEDENKFISNILNICSSKEIKLTLPPHNETEIIARHRHKFSDDLVAMKSQGLEANTAMLTRLANEPQTRRVLFEKVGSGQTAFHYEKWRVIKEEVAEELALRATDNGSINTHALNSVLSTIQMLISQRQSITT